jgi:hypothetical protein
MSELPNRSSGDSATTVQISPPDIVRRRVTAWGGVRAEVIEVIRRDEFEYKFHAPHHLLIMSERTSRDDGETLVDGLPTVRDFGMPALTHRSQSLSMNVPTACTSPMTKWRVTCFLTATRTLLPSPEILMQKLQPCYANARAEIGHAPIRPTKWR